MRSTSGWLFHAKAEFKFASPKERAANLQTVINGLNSTISALEPAELEGRSEDLQLLDEETLRYFGQNHLEIENFSYDSSTLIVFLKQLVRVAKSEKKKLLDMDRAPPRLPNKIPVKEIMECWKVQFGELPSTYPESTFAEIIADLRGDDVTPDALAQELKRARESILKQRKNKFVPMLFLFT